MYVDNANCSVKLSSMIDNMSIRIKAIYMYAPTFENWKL